MCIAGARPGKRSVSVYNTNVSTVACLRNTASEYSDTDLHCYIALRDTA